MNAWEFMGEHPWITFGLALIAYDVVAAICNTIAATRKKPDAPR